MLYLLNYCFMFTDISDTLITIREIDTYYRNYRKQCTFMSCTDTIVNYSISNSKSNAYITFQLPYKMFLQPQSKTHCACTDNHLIRDHSITFIPSRSDRSTERNFNLMPLSYSLKFVEATTRNFKSNPECYLKFISFPMCHCLKNATSRIWYLSPQM